MNNVVLTFSLMEDAADRINEVNENLHPLHSRNVFRVPGDDVDWYGGTKALEHSVFVAAFNFVSNEEIISAIRATKWREPRCVRLFSCDQEEDFVRQVYPEEEEE